MVSVGDRPARAGAVPVGRRPATSAPGPTLGVRFPVERPMPTDRLRSWLLAILLAFIGGILRFYRLGFPSDHGTPVFDEKHYVPQAWQMLRNFGVEDNPGFELVVHPPLAKQLIALGEWVWGYDSMGWRVSAAVAGTVCVLLVVRIARRLTRSTMFGVVAGALFLCDGVSFVQSRMGMLDIFLTVFVLASFGAMVLDRDDVRARMAVVVAEGRVGVSPFGPRLGVRWWRFTAGVLIGMACAVKWSGVYWVAAFGVLSLGWDVAARRAAGVRRPWLGVWVRDVGPALWALAAIPILTYLAGWWAWFASETGVDRHEVGQEIGVGGPFSFMPDALRSLWYYSGHVLSFHANLTTSTSAPHPWESKPWAWPMSLRPMLYYLNNSDQTCGAKDCVSATMLVGTPALWWASPLALVWAVWRTVTRFDWRHVAIMVGYGAGYLPWFLDIDRQMYYFYATPMAPFLIFGLTLMLGDVLGPALAGTERRATGLLIISLYVGLAVANFAWLWPIMVGDSITSAHWDAEMWLPSWR
ncbi:dolichyl-phosphate-mannose--protein mannosyltransferase [Pseudonocardia spinosispora]|uniref:dolichyl-phosphate-mannose--protein mannosyltransferase n=1 Tax=Pseudonocardia spinosispora TaxID=103441 RepID=UPI00048EDFC7|nr:phospholipid carrier-dependent glycosyltransferase [Pseudonocardia spinosispora]